MKNHKEKDLYAHEPLHPSTENHADWKRKENHRAWSKAPTFPKTARQYLSLEDRLWTGDLKNSLYLQWEVCFGFLKGDL